MSQLLDYAPSVGMYVILTHHTDLITIITRMFSFTSPAHLDGHLYIQYITTYYISLRNS